MNEVAESKVDRSVFETTRSIYVIGKTGVFTIERGTETSSYFFVGGELYFGRDHSLAEWTEALLETDDDRAADDSLSAQIRRPNSLLAETVDVLSGRNVDSGSFSPSVSDIPANAIGPLPTAELIMEAAVRGRDEFQLLRRLGGEKRKLVAVSDLLSKRRLPTLDTHEAFMLSRAENPATVRDLLTQSSLDKMAALVTICRLDAIGLLVAAELGSSTSEGRLVSDDVIARFSDRIGKSLEEYPLGLSKKQHGLEVVQLLGRLGALNHYDLLQIQPTDPAERIYQAFTDLARKVHPSHSASLSIDGRGMALDLLFERAVEAYLTLSDPVRNRTYRDLVQTELARPAAVDQSSEERLAERREVAEQSFSAARALTISGDYHSAINLLQQAVRTDPQARYFALLGRCQAKNPQWSSEARVSYERALELAPDEIEVRVRYAELLINVGEAGRAATELSLALERNPLHERASEMYSKLEIAGVTTKAKPSESSGLANRLRGLFRR